MPGISVGRISSAAAGPPASSKMAAIVVAVEPLARRPAQETLGQRGLRVGIDQEDALPVPGQAPERWWQVDVFPTPPFLFRSVTVWGTCESSVVPGISRRISPLLPIDYSRRISPTGRASTRCWERVIGAGQGGSPCSTKST